MKKLLSILLISALSIVLVSCSTTNNDTDTSNNDAETTITTTEATTESSNTIKKDIDAVAAYLGYSDGEEQYYEMIGAKAGKAYNDGKLEIYLFDETSDSYKAAIEGGGLVKADAYKDGIILVFPNNADQNLIDKFNNIEFK